MPNHSQGMHREMGSTHCTTLSLWDQTQLLASCLLPFIICNKDFHGPGGAILEMIAAICVRLLNVGYIIFFTPFD